MGLEVVPVPLNPNPKGELHAGFLVMLSEHPATDCILVGDGASARTDWIYKLRATCVRRYDRFRGFTLKLQGDAFFLSRPTNCGSGTYGGHP